MTSSSSSTNHISNLTAAEENLYHLRQLPFHIYFTNPYSPLPSHFTYLNFNPYFQQITSGITPISPPPQRLRLIETEYHYRYIIDSRPIIPIPTNTNRNRFHREDSTSPSSSHSFSSLPDLIPISNHPEDTTVDQTPELSHTDLPRYTPPEERPPGYYSSRSRQLILRRIRILERESLETRNHIIEEHHQQISDITSNTERRLNIHESTLREEIRTLEDSLLL